MNGDPTKRDRAALRIAHELDSAARRKRRRERALKSVAVLPSLATLGNLVCGFGAVYLCLLSMQGGAGNVPPIQVAGKALFPSFLAMAAYVLVMAMFFDGVDGRLARLTRKTSEFGGQLDSLADVVSFGVAPAILVLCLVRPENLRELTGWQRVYWRAEWIMAAIYVCCAALRLARFNVENVEDESAHMGFRGLPSPGAAATIIGLVLFHQDLLLGLAPSSVIPHTVAVLMPPFAAGLGLLMVSRVPYIHMVNLILRGRRPFTQVVTILILFLVGLFLQPQLTIALAATAYALSGPVVWLNRRLQGQRLPGSVQVTPTMSGSPASSIPAGNATGEGSSGKHDQDSSRPAV